MHDASPHDVFQRLAFQAPTLPKEEFQELDARGQIRKRCSFHPISARFLLRELWVIETQNEGQYQEHFVTCFRCPDSRRQIIISIIW